VTTRAGVPAKQSAKGSAAGSAGSAPPARGAGATGLGPAIGCAHRALRSAWEERIADLGLSAPQAAVVRAVADGSGVGLRELARRMRTDAMNVKRLADHLEAAGLVCSKADPAHRQRRLLCATDEGRRAASQLASRSRAWEGHLEERLGAGALGRLRALLRDLEDALEAEAGAGSSRGAAPAEADRA